MKTCYKNILEIQIKRMIENTKEMKKVNEKLKKSLKKMEKYKEKDIFQTAPLKIRILIYLEPLIKPLIVKAIELFDKLYNRNKKLLTIEDIKDIKFQDDLKSELLRDCINYEEIKNFFE